MTKSLKKLAAAKPPKKPKAATVTLRAAARAPRPQSGSAPLPTPVAVEPVHPQTKAAAILELLSQRDGATIKELAAAANWQEHSVRGFLSGTLKKKRGLQVTHAMVDGLRRYHVDQPRSGQ